MGDVVKLNRWKALPLGTKTTTAPGKVVQMMQYEGAMFVLIDNGDMYEFCPDCATFTKIEF